MSCKNLIKIEILDFFVFYTYSNLLSLYINYLKNIKLAGDHMFAVRIKKTNEYIGNIRINHIDYHNKNCGYGRLLGNQSQRGKNYGQLMLYKICDYAFKKLKMNFHELYLYYLYGFSI